MIVSLRRASAALLLTACTHTDAFVTPIVTLGPVSTGPDVQLTFNVDQNYWPTWTQDGRGILYSFVNLENTAHRCLGLLPAAGGTRAWELCDNRAVRRDSVSSYTAYALDSTGRLLLVEALSSTGFGSSLPSRVRLQLTDTATPYVRTTLLTLPITVGGTAVTWLSEITWTGPNTFLALGQELELPPNRIGSLTADSAFGIDGGIVLIGTLAAGHATLQIVAGTDSATDYSLAENGASIVYSRRHDLRLFKVPIAGGIPVPAPIVRTVPDTASLLTGELAGVSCKASTCLVALDRIFVAGSYFGVCGIPPMLCPISILAGYLPQQAAGTGELHRISLASGTDEIVQSNALIVATPQISPSSGDVVVQLGGVWGHLQTHATFGRGNGELHLLKGLVP